MSGKPETALQTANAQRMVAMFCRVSNPSHPRFGSKVQVVGTNGDLCVCESLDSYSRNWECKPEDLQQIEKKWEWVDVRD